MTACVGKATKITAASSAADEYTWDFGTASSATGAGAGPYQVTWASSNVYTVSLTAKEGQCQAQTQHLITVNPSPIVSINSSGVAACAGSDVSLDATGASTYQWSPAAGLSNAGVANPVAQLQNNNITYTVTGTDDNGCSATATITLELSSDCLGYYVPDAFTPNGDGRNDEFRVKTVDAPRAFSLQVFNRWGAKVFESSSVGTGWNGTVGGTTAPTGTYVYVVQATSSAGTLVRRQGTILLIR
jgi:gliding motility-associated-like protein